MKKSDVRKAFIYTGIFAIAMGFLEAVVVVYLRELYYPEGFHFPLRVFSQKIYGIEIIREASTLVMLLMVGVLTGKSFHERFAFFLYSFGVWDIVYYIALKLFLDWPPGILSWDILFLIPITWIGPVLAPVICSLTMITLSVVLVSVHKRRNIRLLGTREWSLLLSGSLLVFLAFIRDFTLLMIRNGYARSPDNLFQNDSFVRTIESFIPQTFGWLLFGTGEVLLILGIILIITRHKRKTT